MPRHRDYDSYDDYSDSPPRRSDRHRDRDPDRDRRNKPAYKEEEIIEARGAAPVAAARRDALVRRQMSDDSIEEVRRDFPPGGDPAYARRTTRRARSDVRGRYDDDYSDDDRYDRRRKRDKRYDDRRGGQRRRDYSSSSSASPAPRRRKSLGEQALAALGVGGLAGAAAADGRDRDRGGRDRSRGGRRHRRHSSSSSSSRSRSRSVDQQAKIQQAVKAALIAGATEAFRSRKEPGGWAGAKGKRVLTAAIGAGGIDGIVNGNKDPEKKGTRHTIEAVIGGLAGNTLINGGRDKSRDRGGGRHSDRESGGGGLEKLLGAGAAAAAGKAFLDRARSKSRDRGRKDYSSDSDDSRGPPRGSKKRSKSVTEYARQGMAALGIGADQKRDSHGSRRGYDDEYYSKSSREPRLRGGGGDGGRGISNSSSSRLDSDSTSDSDSDATSDSSEDKRKSKKLGHKELITAGLASVATIHAAHSVYQSYHAREVRLKEVAEGKISPEEARKKKNKARLQEAASVGIAAIGIKGAISEWKEVKESREEHHKFEEERQKRHEQRLKRLEDRLNSEKQHPQIQYTGRPNTGIYSHSDPGLVQKSNPQTPAQATPYWNGPHYGDGNPYAAEGLPPPPIGSYQPRH